MARTVLRNHPSLFMPRELLGEPGVYDARGRAVDRVHRDPFLARDTTGTSQRVVTIAFESHEDVDTATDDAAPRIVREAETVMNLSRRERDADEGRNVEHGPELDASGIHGHCPVWHQPVSRRPDAERCAAHDEISHSSAETLLDVEDSAVPELRRALDVQLAPEFRRDSRNQLPVAGEQFFAAIPCQPFRFVEDAVEGRNEGTQ